MSVSDSIKEFWKEWEECSKEEYLNNRNNYKSYTYFIDLDNNNKLIYKKRKEGRF